MEEEEGEALQWHSHVTREGEGDAQPAWWKPMATGAATVGGEVLRLVRVTGSQNFVEADEKTTDDLA